MSGIFFFFNFTFQMKDDFSDDSGRLRVFLRVIESGRVSIIIGEAREVLSTGTGSNQSL